MPFSYCMQPEKHGRENTIPQHVKYPRDMITTSNWISRIVAIKIGRSIDTNLFCRRQPHAIKSYKKIVGKPTNNFGGKNI